MIRSGQSYATETPMKRITTTAATFVSVTATLLALAGGLARGSSPSHERGGPTRPLTADAFIRSSRDVTSGNPVDQPGPLLYDTVRVPLLPGDADRDPAVRAIDPTVQSVIRPPSEGTTRPIGLVATAPGTQPVVVAVA